MTVETNLHIPLGTVLIIDFGGQYTHLIARRIRELKVYAVIKPYDKLNTLDLSKYHAVIFSGSHKSILHLDQGIYESIQKLLQEGNTPILGICFGHQILAVILGGKVRSGCGEYGRVKVKIKIKDPLFEGWDEEETVWMSHSDCVDDLPKEINILAVSENGYISAFKTIVNNRPIYGVQFHPEVIHTRKGVLLIDNFLDMTKALREWTSDYYYRFILDEISKTISKGRPVIAAVSGGVDSTVSAILVKKIVGEKLIPVFVDHGLFRDGEPEEIVEYLRNIGLEPIYINARERFLSKLEHVADCEERRLIIGEEFAVIFNEVMEKMGADTFVQGTTYPDIVESGAIRLSNKIKTHHNVAGLPSWFREKYKVIEPVKYLYKDEVRALGRMFGIPSFIIDRHPFPGPGLSVRIIGSFTREKLEICRKASKIIEEVLRKHALLDKVWQAFAVVGDDKWVGVKGDARKYGYVVTVRIVESVDAMTADYSKIPYEILDEISKIITSVIENVTMVTYAITTKPPSTIEPC